jgi:DNA invertase Pin-like site-specific DNA recombinase
MPRYGYARGSSTDQDCALQDVRLRQEGCKLIRAEKASGKSRDGRDELTRIMDFLPRATNWLWSSSTTSAAPPATR